MSDQHTPNMKSTTSAGSTKRKPGRQKGWKKADQQAVPPKGNPDFNINDAEPLGLDIEALLNGETEAPMVADTTNLPKVESIADMEKKRFAKPTRAPSAITDEDLNLDIALQQLHVAQELPRQEDGVPLKLTEEERTTEFLGDVMADYKPASTINDLEGQVHQAKSMRVDSIEASDAIIKYFCRDAFPEKQGFFIYKDIKVFITGRAKDHKTTDRGNMWAGTLY
jgi:hypothetical protein